MTLTFHTRFTPLTATPFSRADRCIEAAPCPALRPLVRCFWGHSAAQGAGGRQLVIPDACVDIIFTLKDGRVRTRFCALDQRPFWSDLSAQTPDLFAVRFYFWALPFLCPGGLPALEETLIPALSRLAQEGEFATLDFAGRKALLERWLLGRLSRASAPDALLDSIDYLLSHGGDARVCALSVHTGYSARTLERLFAQHLGASPKQTAALIRYQTLWNRALTQPRFDVQDQVLALGFCDQAHLLHFFRQHHGMSLGQAVRLARGLSPFYNTGGGLL